MAAVLFTAGLTGLWAGGSSEKSESGGTPLTLRVLTVYTPDHSVGPAVDAINALFKEKYPNVVIEMQTMPADDLKQTLRVDLESGDPPAVFNLWYETTNKDYIDAGKLYNFKKALDADPAWKNNFKAGALSVHTYGTDGIWGVPQAQFATGMYYNKKIFAQAGISGTPDTMAEFISDMKKIGALEGITPMVFGNADGWRSAHLLAGVFFKQNGCQAARDLAARKIKYTDSGLEATYKTMQDMAESGIFGKDYTGLGYADEVSLFNEGKAAVRFSGTWTLGEIKGVDAGFFPFPYFADKPQYKNNWQAGYADGWGMAAGLDPELEKAALEYIKLWTGPVGSKIFAEVAKNIPAGKADVDPAKTGDLFAMVLKSMETMKDSLSDFAAPERVTAVKDAISTNTQAVVAGAVTPEEAVERIQEAVDANK